MQPSCKDIFAHLGDAAPLWETLIQSGDIESRNKVFEYYLPWSKQIASSLYVKYRTDGMEWEDFVHFCALGLIDSIEKFDVGKGVPFEAYAYKFLKGSALSGAKCFMQEKTISSEREAIIRSSRLPEIPETADSFEAIVDAVVGLAFGQFLESGVAQTSDPTSAACDHYAQEREFERIADSVSKLNESQQFIIRSHYFHHLSFVEIAKVMQLSRARVSQLHQSALKQIRLFYEQDCVSRPRPDI